VIHAAVGSYRQNAFGLFDVHGNVWEWCFDCYGAYGSERAGDGRNEVESDRRCFRGGSFSDAAVLARSSNRYYNAPQTSNSRLGVRAARALQPLR
jgi:formylglycine-generating enzyme required for sulfatase activity